MKLCFTTLGCPDWTWEEVLRCAEKYGIPYLEIRQKGNGMEAEEPWEFSSEQAENTKKQLAERNLTIVCLGTSVFFHDSEKYARAIREGKRAIDVCERMAIPYIRVFGDQIPPQEDESGVTDRVIRGIRELCVYGRNKGVTVLLEIHGNFNRIEPVSQIVAALSEYNFGILWDIQHSDKIYQDRWREFYEIIKPYVRHVHIRDQRGRTGSEPENICLIGDGDVPLKEVILQLQKDGYDGCFSLEWEKQWVPDLPELPVALESMVRFFDKIEDNSK